MELGNESLEDGEISDDSDGCYKPLERPANYSTNIANPRFPTITEQESDQQSELSSSSDSDSSQKKTKRPKLKPLRNTSSRTNKKYDIWSSKVQEDILSETLISCDVSIKDRSRTVETYDYTLGAKLFGKSDSERTNNKRTFDDRNNKNIKPNKRKASKDDKKVKGTSRTILDLTCTQENTCEEIAKDVANKLYEEKEDLIMKIAEVAGKEKVLQIFKETKRIEEDGGMLIMNQTRRRTPGGVFIFLVKHDSDLTEKQLAKIFEDEREKYKYAQKIRKKMKKEQIKAKRDKSKREVKMLPELLTRTELCVQRLADRPRRQSEESIVKNPPPSPVTDLHESSGDGLEPINNLQSEVGRRLTGYEDDFLDLSAGNAMDLL